MHVRRDCYIGVAPVPGGLTNVCLVQPSGAGDAALARSRGAADARARRAIRCCAIALRRAARGTAGGPRARWRWTSRAHDDRRAAARRRRRGIHRSDDRRRPALRGPGRRARRGGGACRRSSMDGPASTRGSAADRRRAFASKWRFNRALRALVVVAARHRRGGASPRGSRPGDRCARYRTCRRLPSRRAVPTGSLLILCRRLRLHAARGAPRGARTSARNARAAASSRRAMSMR